MVGTKRKFARPGLSSNFPLASKLCYFWAYEATRFAQEPKGEVDVKENTEAVDLLCFEQNV